MDRLSRDRLSTVAKFALAKIMGTEILVLRMQRNTSGAHCLKTQKHYRDRAAYMREIAKTAQTQKMRESCLEAAKEFDALAKQAAEDEADNKS